MSNELLIAIIGPVFTVIGAIIGFFLKEIYKLLKNRYSWRKDLVNKLRHLLTNLDESKSIFLNQVYKRNRLYGMLRKNHPNDITNGKGKGYKGYNDLFKKLYLIFTDEEKELHSLIRSTSRNSMRRVNREIQDWLKEGHLLKIEAFDIEEMKAFLDRLPQLRDHLNDWFDIYEGIFLKDDKYSLIYTADEKEHGVGFPTGIEDTLRKAIASLE